MSNELTHSRGLRRERVQSSPNFDPGGVVINVMPTPQVPDVRALLRATSEYLDRGVERVPRAPLPLERPDTAKIARRARGLRVTWLGHSTMLVAVDGALFLTDPVFSKRASPFAFAGPARFHRPPLEIDALPPLDAVVLSHDHYDHLDKAAVLALAKTGVPFYVPLGVGHHLTSWGIPVAQVHELDWWERAELAGVELHCCPSRHFSGRGAPGTGNRTLWCSWAFVGPRHRAWFSGDTGPWEGFAEIGRRLGPFDLTMIETGAWHPAWGNIHLGPREAVRLHELVDGRTLLPVHWGTFNLALHAWDEPIVQAQELMFKDRKPMIAPVAGQTLQHDQPFIADPWRERWRRWRDTAPLIELLDDPQRSG